MLDGTLRLRLTAIGRASIAHGLEHGVPMVVPVDDAATELAEKRATFVTLRKYGQLRGCIGHLEPRSALAQSVADNAFAAAFRDPRFDAVSVADFTVLEVGISLLSPPEPMRFASEADLLRQLRPGIDGLILADGECSGTFLPSVWETLPGAEEFVRQLKRKAGLAENYWSETLTVSRYTTESWY